MREFVRPIVVVSKCLGFAHCRFNGLTISSEPVEKLKPHVDFRTVCPEVEIGLGIPRDPVRIVSSDDELRLIQPATGDDVTDRMRDFTDSFLRSIEVSGRRLRGLAGERLSVTQSPRTRGLSPGPQTRLNREEADGFILKSRSPSCGIKDVKIYSSTEKVMPSSRGGGFFGGEVMRRFPDLAIEDEGRLTNFRIREHFLTKLFTIARFRAVRSASSMKELARFHTENKLLLMAYNQEKMRVLGRIVANPESKPVHELISDYEENLSEAFSRAARYTSNINVLMHGLGYFSKDISSNEKAFFLDSLERYKSGKVPLSVPLYILRSLIFRFREDYLMQQTFFEPYPEELMEITDSGKGRDL